MASLGAYALAIVRPRRAQAVEAHDAQPPNGASGSVAPGRPLDWIDLRDFGASRNGRHDATPAVQRAIREALNEPDGGVIYAPLGTYMITDLLGVPRVVNKTVRFVGQGRRGTVFTAARRGMTTLLRWGDAARDQAGNDAEEHTTMYGSIENITLNAADGARDVTLLEMVEPQFVTVREVNLEGARHGYGLKLLGSKNTGGLSAPAYPHAWRCKYYDLFVDDCRHPAYLENADENDFFSCNFRLPKGLRIFGANAAGADVSDSLFAIEIVEGRNNRWFGGLLMGDTDPRYRPAYVGAMLRAPVHGDVRNNQWHGMVIEGFHRTAIIGNANVLGTTFLLEHRSMSDEDVLNTTSPAPRNKTMVHSPVADTWYYAGRLPYNDPLSYVLPVGDTVVSTIAGNIVVLSSSAISSVVTDFSDGRDGQTLIACFSDDRVTVRASAALRLAGGRDFRSAANATLSLVRVAGAWREVSRSVT